MKKLLFIPVLALAAFFTSCSDNDEVSPDLAEIVDLDSEAALESNYEDVDVIVNAGMESLNTGARVSEDDVLDCATITHDEVNNTLTIDYGDGCEGPGGRIRAGKLVITYNDRRLVPGSFRQIVFENFSIDGVLIEGTRRVENISESIDVSPVFQVTLVGGKMTFEDGTFATRDSDHTRTWVRADNPINDETQVEGTASGSRRDGVTYSIEIIERLVFRRACRGGRVFIAVAGVKKITWGDNVAIVDYGDGECDNEVTITINDGEPFVKTIEPKGRK